MLVEILDARISVRGCIITVCEDSRVRNVQWQKVFQPHLPIIRRPCLLPEAVEAVNSDNAWKEGYSDRENKIFTPPQLTLLADPPLRPAISAQETHCPHIQTGYYSLSGFAAISP